jgi:hypothetical protein
VRLSNWRLLGKGVAGRAQFPPRECGGCVSLHYGRIMSSSHSRKKNFSAKSSGVMMQAAACVSQTG